jgi:cell division septal protein FtsQ
MNSIEKELTKERKVVHQGRKILRIKPIVWAQRYWFFLSLILIVICTFLFGTYDIRKITYKSKDNQYVKESTVRDLISDNLGRNFFGINPDTLEQKFLENAYVKSVDVEKVFPNELVVEIEEYVPFLLFESESICNIFSIEGVLLETKTEIDCTEYAKEIEVIYFKGESTQIVEEEGKKYFYLSDEVSDISKVLKTFDIEIVEITLEGNILTIYTNSCDVVIDINQELDTELARLYLVLEELENLEKEAKSIDTRFERPVIQIDK